MEYIATLLGQPWYAKYKRCIELEDQTLLELRQNAVRRLATSINDARDPLLDFKCEMLGTMIGCVVVEGHELDLKHELGSSHQYDDVCNVVTTICTQPGSTA